MIGRMYTRSSPGGEPHRIAPIQTASKRAIAGRGSGEELSALVGASKLLAASLLSDREH